MSRCNDKNRKDLMKFVLNTPFDDEVIHMDCNDGCEQLSRFAERVVSGESLATLMPELKEHMQYWKDCREEFDALVAVLKAEHGGALANFDFHQFLDEPKTPDEPKK